VCIGIRRLTVPVITSLYAALLCLVFVWGLRRARNFARSLRVPDRHRGEITGDVPWAVLLLLLLELGELPELLVHLAGISLLISVTFHVRFVTQDLGRWPVTSGMTHNVIWGWILLVALGVVISTASHTFNASL
jgi:uncharacterized membrane protein YecN with MAPEG domain